MGNFAENLNLGNRFRPPPWDLQSKSLPIVEHFELSIAPHNTLELQEECKLCRNKDLWTYPYMYLPHTSYIVTTFCVTVSGV